MKNRKKSELTSNLVDLYIRVSTTEQAQEGYSVNEQEHRLRQYCGAMGLSIYKVHIDPGYSGASLNRPGIQEVIRDVRSGAVKKVIVWKLDRLSRSQKDTLIMLEDVFLSNGCDFISMLESFDTSTAFGRAIIGILAAFAQLERENIKERTSMGRSARISKGRYSGSHAPLGYHFATGSNDLYINSYEAGIVREIFSLFLSGESVNRIAVIIDEKYGRIRNWNNTVVRRILSNPVYYGKVKENDKLYDGIHDPLISEADFISTNAILEHNKIIKKQSIRSDYLLTGLLYCGDCGARMQPRRIAKGYPLKRYVCYSVSRSSKFMIKSDNCSNRLHPFTIEELDNIIKAEIQKLTVDETYLNEIFSESKDPEDNSHELFQERLNEVQKQIDKLLNLFQIGVIDISDISDRLENLKKEKDALQRNIERSIAESSFNPEEIRSHANSFQAALDSEDTETAKKLIRMLIDKIVVLNDNIEIHWNFS